MLCHKFHYYFLTMFEHVQDLVPRNVMYVFAVPLCSEMIKAFF